MSKRDGTGDDEDDARDKRGHRPRLDDETALSRAFGQAQGKLYSSHGPDIAATPRRPVAPSEKDFVAVINNVLANGPERSSMRARHRGPWPGAGAQPEIAPAARKEKQARQPVIPGSPEWATVKWYSEARGYGFVTADRDEKDLFLHGSALIRAGLSPSVLSAADRVNNKIRLTVRRSPSRKPDEENVYDVVAPTAADLGF